MADPLVKTGTLFVVATPLGNLADLTDRARTTLAEVPVVAAEDTRRTQHLLAHLGIRPRLISFHAHSPGARLQQVLELLREGQSVAVVTDAGTPTISDPGALLVDAAREAGFAVVPIPGPSAVATALSISGIGADRYIFLGFLPRRGQDRKRLLDLIASSEFTVVLFESPLRLVDLLDELSAKCGGERKISVARELTKLHEEIQAGPLAEVTAHFREHHPRGEVTVVLEAATPREAGASEDRTEQVRERARSLLAEGRSKRDVAQIVAQELHVSRNEAYRMVTAL